MEKQNEKLRKEIEAIIATANSPEEAFKKISQAYPSISEEELKKNYEAEKKKAEQDFKNLSKSEAVENLSDEALEEVAGGNFGSWVKKNWPYLVAGAVFIGFSAGVIQKSCFNRPNTAVNAAGETHNAPGNLDIEQY